MTESIERMQGTADVYASALFALASEKQSVDAVRGELEELSALQRSDAAFAAFLSSTALDADKRELSLEKMFRGRLSDMTLNTLHVMNRNGRSALLDAVLRRFVVQAEEAAGQVEVTATSAVELDDAQRGTVTETAAKLSGKAPVMEFRVDPAIVGGLVLQVGDIRYDNSVRSQLKAARARLLERAERGFSAPRP